MSLRLAYADKVAFDEDEEDAWDIFLAEVRLAFKRLLSVSLEDAKVIPSKNRKWHDDSWGVDELRFQAEISHPESVTLIKKINVPLQKVVEDASRVSGGFGRDPYRDGNLLQMLKEESEGQIPDDLSRKEDDMVEEFLYNSSSGFDIESGYYNQEGEEVSSHWMSQTTVDARWRYVPDIKLSKVTLKRSGNDVVVEYAIHVDVRLSRVVPPGNHDYMGDYRR